MRFWFVHSSEVSLREQVVAQVSLGILSGELTAGERLPSVRELARRFGIHANTVSAGYQQLVDQGWVESRRGSGVFVRGSRPPAGIPCAAGVHREGGMHPEANTGSAAAGALSREPAIERVLTSFFHATRRLGLSEAEALDRVRQWAGRESMRRLLLVEPDPALARIVLAELAALLPASIASGLALDCCAFGECASNAANKESLARTLVVALPSKLEAVRAEVRAVQAEAGCGFGPVLALRIRPVPTSLAEALPRDVRAHAGTLIGIASGWAEFLRFTRTMLIATGFAPEALVLRDTAEPGWRAGLEEAAVTVCDALTAKQLATRIHAGGTTIVFRLLHEDVADQLRQALREHQSQDRSQTDA